MNLPYASLSALISMTNEHCNRQLHMDAILDGGCRPKSGKIRIRADRHARAPGNLRPSRDRRRDGRENAGRSRGRG